MTSTQKAVLSIVLMVSGIVLVWATNWRIGLALVLIGWGRDIADKL